MTERNSGLALIVTFLWTIGLVAATTVGLVHWFPRATSANPWPPRGVEVSIVPWHSDATYVSRHDLDGYTCFTSGDGGIWCDRTPDRR